jgi:hypothetical protein
MSSVDPTRMGNTRVGQAKANATEWARSPSEAIEIARDFSGTVIVDLDETLYLRNSTEQFISLATPGVLAALLLRMLDWIKPWQWTGGSDCRDNWRVMLVITAFPWTLLRWRRFCKTHVRGVVNLPLQAALRERNGSTVIASNGYRLIIEPMLDALELQDIRLICCDLYRFSHRTGGKLLLLREHMRIDEIRSSSVITDSLKDGPLLAECAVPCLVVWEAARYEPAFRSMIYLPGDYLSQIKRPNRRALRTLAKDDLLPWILAGLSATPTLMEAVGLFCLFFSMWCFYEIGYYDNDQCAIKYESDANFFPQAANVDRSFLKKSAATGLVLGLAGVILIAPGWRGEALLTWFAGMVALVCVYWLYNRLDKNSRVWLYLPLQLFRSGALFLLVASNTVGYALAGSQMLTRWIDYVIYRYLREKHGIVSFPQRPQKTVRVMICFLMIVPLVLHAQWYAFMVPATLGIAFFLFEALRWERKVVLGNAHRLDRVR